MFASIFQKLADFQASLVGGVNFIREKLGFNPIEGFDFIDRLAEQEQRRAAANLTRNSTRTPEKPGPDV